MKRKLPTTNAGAKRKSLFSLIACWFSKEEPVCGGGAVKPSEDASSESKDGKVCSNGEIRL